MNIVVEPGIPFCILDSGVAVGCTDFIETGTQYGYSIDKALARYEHIWSCEIDESLAYAAKKRYEAFPRVKVLHDHSVHALQVFAGDIGDRQALAWLDAHDGHCPLLGELEILGGLPTHPVIVIDDIEDMGTKPNYPTVMQICEAICAIDPRYTFTLMPSFRRGILVACPYQKFFLIEL